MMNVAACQNCGKVVKIEVLREVRLYHYAMTYGGGKQNAVDDGERMFCPDCHAIARDAAR